MDPRTVGAIALRPTGNELGGHYFISLATGRRLLQNRWTPLPLPSNTIRQVNQLACRNPKGLIFTNRSSQPLMAEDDTEEDHGEEDMPELTARTSNNDKDDEYYSSDEEDSMYEPEDEDDESAIKTNANITGVNKDNITGVTAQPEESQNNNEDNLHPEPGAPELQITGYIAPNDEQITPDESDRSDTYNSKPWHEREAHLIAETPAGNKKVTINMPATIIPQNKDGQHDPPRRAGLRPRKRRNLVPSKFKEQAHTMFQIGENFPAYTEVKIHLHHNNKTAKHNLENDPINHTIMTQYH
eukprot:7468777-Ditylum_brightwellii.AAC.1